MASRTPQLRQSFLLTGVGVTLVLVIGFAALSGNTAQRTVEQQAKDRGDRKSTRLNSSHSQISYAVFCLKKKKRNNNNVQPMLNTVADIYQRDSSLHVPHPA